MKGEQKSKNVIAIFRLRLDSIIDIGHELCLLADDLDWDWIDGQLSQYYSNTGRPGVPIRTIVGMLLLKHFYD